MKQRQKTGFSIVELIVVIVVIGILVGLGIFGISSWRNRVAVTEVTNDMKNVATAMKSELNHNNKYPVSLPPGFTPSQGVTVTYKLGNDDNYCIEGVSKVKPNVKMFVSSSDGIPKTGSCS